MGSTFSGLETARRSMAAQQAALYTTSHNIANANTEGFTRQRVVFESVQPSTAISRNADLISGQIGGGAEPQMIERVRNDFLDEQFRGENSNVGFYESMTESMNQMETIMNEPSEQGLAKTMDRFWQSLQDLSVNPQDSGSRSVVKQRGIAVAETFNYLSNSLNDVRDDLKHNIDVTKNEVNSLLQQIQNVNKLIKSDDQSFAQNDLFDERDRLIDKLSNSIDVSVSFVNSDGNPARTGYGRVTIELNGTGEDVKLIDGQNGTMNQLYVGYDANNNVDNLIVYNPADPNQPVEIDQENPPTGTSLPLENFQSTGRLQALIEANGYNTSDGRPEGIYKNTLDDLDQLAKTFADKFNSVHTSGRDLKGEEGQAFFEYDENQQNAARNLRVTTTIQDDIERIAATGRVDGGPGDGANALELANVMRDTDVSLGVNTSIPGFYQSMISEVAVVSQESQRMLDNVSILRQQVEENRKSVSSVSMDEELTNMIKFQHGFNAAARNMTAVDEMLDTIINKMGIVGR